MTTTDVVLAHLAQDPVLARIIAETPDPKPAYSWADDPAGEPIYLALLESIVSQQISVKAADAIFRRFRALFPDGVPQPDRLLRLTTDELRSAGLSFQKIRYVQSAAEFAQQHRLDRPYFDTLTDEEIVQYLIPIRGVGRWTVEMLLMFVLDRPDVFPVDDLVIRQRIVRAYGLTETGRPLYRRLHDIGEPWRPYRTTACRYLWRWQPD